MEEKKSVTEANTNIKEDKKQGDVLKKMTMCEYVPSSEELARKES
jgi:hypothetical protein